MIRNKTNRYRSYNSTDEEKVSTVPDRSLERTEETVKYGRVVGSAIINVRASPNEDAPVLAQLLRFAPVRIDSEDGDYYCVTFGVPDSPDARLTGFVQKEYCGVI